MDLAVSHDHCAPCAGLGAWGIRPVATSPASGSAAAAVADRIFVAKRFVTLEEDTPTVTAVAVADGRIVAVGEKDELLASHWAGEATGVTDLGDACVVPGFVESHAHPPMVGSSLEQVDVTPEATDSIEAVLAAIKARVESLPAGSWVQARGYDQGNMTAKADQRPLLAADLDTVAPEHYVVVVSNSGHITYVNSLLLQKAGIGGADTTFTGSLGNRVVVMDGEGKPTGELQGSGEWALSH